MDYFDFQSLVTTNIALFFTSEYTWAERLMAPFSAAKFMIDFSLTLIKPMEEYWAFWSVVVGLVVHLQNQFKDHMARTHSFYTFVNVYSPTRKYFNFSKIVVWMILAPFYPVYLVVVKSIVYVPALYMLPFFAIAYFFNKHQHFQHKIKEHALTRYQRSL